MNIDAGTYELISQAIVRILKAGRPLTYTELVEGIQERLEKQGTPFTGSVPWYAVTVKKDMEARGILTVYTEKGRKLHRLSK